MTEYITIEPNARHRKVNNWKEIIQKHIDKFPDTNFVFSELFKNTLTYQSEDNKYRVIIHSPEYRDVLTASMTVQDFCALDADEVYYYQINQTN